MSANVVNCIDLTIDTNVVLTTNGYDIYCAGNFINYGTIMTGSDGNGGTAGQAGIGVPNSFAGSGGGAGASTAIDGENGGSTLVLGGVGGTITSENGNPGNSPASPTISNANIITWSGNFIGYFSSGGGGGGLSGSGVIGGNGVYGLYIQASNIIAGSISANGIAGGSGALLTSAGAGGGGGAFVLLSYVSGGYTAGTYNTIGGNGGTGATGYGNGGSGGSGNVVAYDYGTIPPIDIISLPSISQSTSGDLDAGQSVTFSTSFVGGVSPYTYNWIVSNTISGATVANSLYTSSLTSNSFTWSIAPSVAGNTVYANVIITDTQSSNSQGSDATVNSIESGTIKVNAAPSVISITPSATTLDSGQSVTYNSEITGGTSPFTANLIYVSGPGTVNSITEGNVVETLTGQSDGTITFPSFNSFSATGSYTFNVVVIDSASTPVTFNSISNTITVSSSLSPTSISSPSSGEALDSGQSYPISVTPPTTGTPSYSYSWAVTSGYSCPGFTSADTASFVYTTSTATSASCEFTVTVTDSASTHESYNATTPKIVVNPALAISLSPSSNTLDANQQPPLTATVSGGTPIFALTYTTSNTLCGSLSATSNSLSTDGTNTIVFTANSALTSRCATTITSSVIDSAPLRTTANAISSLTINPAPTATLLTPSNTVLLTK